MVLVLLPVLILIFLIFLKLPHKDTLRCSKSNNRRHNMSKPTIVSVHGSWHSPKHLEPLVKVLEDHGYRCVAAALPTMGTTEHPPKMLADDIKAVRDTVEEELEQGNDVVVAAHSYGGHVANRALVGLDKNLDR